MKATRPKIIAQLLVLFLVLGASSASAQGMVPIFDHLKCYVIKDYRTPGQWTANLNPEQAPPFAAELGCKIKSPAKLFCIDVEKIPVGTPTPPLHVVGLKAQDYLCYALKCPVPSPMPTLAVTDQFGQGGIAIKKPKYLCAPAYKVGFPTPTPQPTVTPCNGTCVGGANAGLPCVTQADCPGGYCNCVPTPTPAPTVTPCPKQCIGGTNNGNPCNVPSNCPAGGICSVPQCCCAAQGTPPCTTSTTCPLTGDVCICP